MDISNTGIELIKQFEGFRSKAYKCVSSEKYYTIGYGHYGADVSKDMVITQEEGTELLRKDLEKFEGYVNKHNEKYNWNQNQFDALVSFTYNCGAGNLTKLTNNDKRSNDQISEALLNYNKSGGKVLAGLTKRRQKEKTLFDTNCSSNVEPIKNTTKYYDKYTGSNTSLDVILQTIGVPTKYRGSWTARKPLAVKCGINDYTGTVNQNLKLIQMAKNGQIPVI